MDSTIAAVLLLDGIGNGAVYALLGMAIVLVFAVTRVILIPQGEFVAYSALTLAMLLVGMLNWMFTWLRPEGPLTHAAVTPLVLNLFFDGVRNMPAPAPAPSLVRAARSAPMAGKRAQRARTA